jgi:hypothetical protein
MKYLQKQNDELRRLLPKYAKKTTTSVVATPPQDSIDAIKHSIRSILRKTRDDIKVALKKSNTAALVDTTRGVTPAEPFVR